MPYFDEPVGRVEIQTSTKSQRYYKTKRLIRDLLSNAPNCYVRVGEFRGYLSTQFFCNFNSWLARCEKTCLTGPLEYKYRVIFVLVLGVSCTLRSAVG